VSARRPRPALLLAALVLAVPLGASPSGAAAQSARPAAAKKAEPLRPAKIFPYHETYMRLPAAERTRFQLAYFLLLNGRPAPGADVYVEDGGVRTPIAIAPDGRMQPPPLALLRSKTASVVFPQGTEKFNVQMSLIPTAPLGQEMRAADLAAAIAQANRGIRRAAGVIGLVAPRMGQVKFIGAGSGEAVLADGRRVPLPIVEGAPVYQPAALPNARTLVFARKPTRALLGPAAKRRG